MSESCIQDTIKADEKENFLMEGKVREKQAQRQSKGAGYGHREFNDC